MTTSATSGREELAAPRGPLRKYSLDEIDRMRAAVQSMDWYGGSLVEIDARRENQLRTYMFNGTDPDELERYAAVANERRWAALAAEQREHREARAAAKGSHA